MGRSFFLVLPYPPVTGNHATKHARGRHYTTDAARDYASQVMEVVAKAGLALFNLEGPLDVIYTAHPPDSKARDSDNVMKIVKDALTQADVWADDSNKVIRSETFVWRDPGGDVVTVSITEL